MKSRGVARIELAASRTRSENHTTRPNTQLMITNQYKIIWKTLQIISYTKPNLKGLSQHLRYLDQLTLAKYMIISSLLPQAPYMCARKTFMKSGKLTNWALIPKKKFLKGCCILFCNTRHVFFLLMMQIKALGSKNNYKFLIQLVLMKTLHPSGRQS